jgi:hypothetical protein
MVPSSRIPMYLIDIPVMSKGSPCLDKSNSEGISMHIKRGLSKASFAGALIRKEYGRV